MYLWLLDIRINRPGLNVNDLMFWDIMTCYKESKLVRGRS